MNKIIKSDERYFSEIDWLKTYHLFSFNNYYDPLNFSFGNLRVFNDDLIKAERGFGLHPHSNMEIITIVLDGEITHGDSIGNLESIKSGEIQTITAGSGIFHSEQNISKKDVHLYQIWFTPDQLGLKPIYSKLKIDLKYNNLNLIASGDKEDKIGFLNASVKIYRGIFDKGKHFDYDLLEKRGLFLYLKEGSIKVGDDILGKNDQLRFKENNTYSFEFLENVDFILIDVSL